MRKLSTALLLLITFTAQAGLPPVQIQGQSDASPKTRSSFQVPYNQFTDLGGIKALIETGNANVLSNASFEATGITTSSVPAWTLGTNVTAAANTSSYKDGKQAVTLSTNATGVTGAQVLFYQSLTPGSYDANVNKIARLWVNTSITTLQVCAYLASGTVNCQAVPSSSTWQSVTSNFIMPSSGTIGVALYTTAAISASTVIGSVDKAQVSDADNLSQVSQAQMWGTLTTTGQASCNWATSSSSYADFSAQASCPSPTATGNLTAPGTLVPWAVANNAPPGTYEVTAQFGLFNSATQEVGCRIVDESSNVLGQVNVSRITGDDNPIHLTGVWTYTTPGSHTWKVQCLAGSSVSININNNSSAYNFAIIAKYFPSQSQTALRPDQTPASWSGYHNSSCAWARSGATIGDFTSPGTSCALIERTNRNFGTVTGYGATSGNSALPGIVFTPPRVGRYLVQATFGINNSSTGANTAQLTDGSGNILGSVSTNLPAGNTNTLTMMGILNVTSATSQTVKILGAASANLAQLTAFGAANDSITWNIVELDAPMSAPYLVGSVTTGSAGIDRIEHAGVANSCTASPCTLINPTAGITSITRTGAGAYTANYSAYSAAPELFLSSKTSTIHCEQETPPTTTSAAFTCRVGNTATATDDGFSLFMIGPR